MLSKIRFSVRFIMVLFALVFVLSAAACEKSPADSSSSVALDNEMSISSPPADSEASETSDIPTATPSPAVPEEIVFDLSGDSSSAYRERLFVDANSDLLSVMGGDNSPIQIKGEFTFMDRYCFSSYGNSHQIEYAMDGSSLALILDYGDSGTGRLVYSNGQQALDVATDVDSFHLSVDGSAILYLTGEYEHGIGGSLYYYDCILGTSRLVSTGAGRLYVLSPGGDAISYTTFYKPDNPDTLTCYTSVSGNSPVMLDTDSYCVAISDDAETIYYMKKTDAGDTFHVQFDGVTKQLAQSDGSAENYAYEHSYYFNIDHTQVVFMSSGASWFSMSGCDPFMIIGAPLNGFVGKSYYYDVPDYLVSQVADAARTFVSTYSYGTQNLCNIPFQSSRNSMVYFDENMNIVERSLPEYVQSFTFAGNSLICSDDNTFFHIYTDYLDPDSEVILDYMSPCLTKDKTIYYLTPNEEELSEDFSYYPYNDLHVIFDNSKKQIASGVDSMYLLERDGPDILFYLAYPEDIEGEEWYNSPYPFLNLYSIDESPGAKPLLIAKKVCEVETGDFGIVYRNYKSELDNSYYPGGAAWMAMVNVYYSKDGTSFKYVMQRPYVNQYGG